MTKKSKKQQSIKYKKCPRCGQKKLYPVETLNCWSRRDSRWDKQDVDIYVCKDCGVEEALEDQLIRLYKPWIESQMKSIRAENEKSRPEFEKICLEYKEV